MILWRHFYIGEWNYCCCHGSLDLGRRLDRNETDL